MKSAISPPFIKATETNVYHEILDPVQDYWRVRRGEMIELALPRGTERISSRYMSIYYSPTMKQMVAGHSTPGDCEGINVEGKDFLEYKIPRGCDVWEVAAVILRSHINPPKEIKLEDLPVSAALRVIYENSFFPFDERKKPSPTKARKRAKKDLKRIGAASVISTKELKEKVFETLCYLHNAHAEECTHLRLAAVADCGRYPRTCDEIIAHEPDWDYY